jgi:hypothetical protein
MLYRAGVRRLRYALTVPDPDGIPASPPMSKCRHGTGRSVRPASAPATARDRADRSCAPVPTSLRPLRPWRGRTPEPGSRFHAACFAPHSAVHPVKRPRGYVGRITSPSVTAHVP